MSDIDSALRNLLEEKRSLYPERLFAAMEYALFPAGKRIRPQIMFLSADFLGVDKGKVLPLAIALELIHNYSLIHDDLPCMDDDEIRRGKPSCHKAFGEAIALLAGDALLNLAYEVLFESAQKDPDLLQSCLFLAKNAGAEGMIGGQAIEFSFEDFDDALVTELCLKKTGALIKSAVMCPTFLSFDRKKINAFSLYADAVGLAFQLSDDILDEEKAEKKSYLGVNGKDKTVEMLKKLEHISEKALFEWDDGKALVLIAKQITNRTK